MPHKKRTNKIPYPFLKWVGGKRRLLAQYIPHFPDEFNSYYEPFLGGGAVFFHLQPKRAILSDVNERLVKTYLTIRDDLDRLIELLEKHEKKHEKSYYYKMREQFNSAQESTESAALMIYLNKTCFNGLYRENKKGHFNVPIGKQKKLSLFKADNLRAVSRILQDVTILVSSFELIQAKKGDFVFFDPPYVPQNNSFTSYTKTKFTLDSHQHLANVFADLDSKGCKVMLSNSNTPYVHELFAQYSIHEISVQRNISGKASARRPITELLVKNW